MTFQVYTEKSTKLAKCLNACLRVDSSPYDFVSALVQDNNDVK